MENSTYGNLPPGTQRIETSAGTEIVLSPAPTEDPNQPLNWPRWRKVLHVTLLCLYTILVFAVLTVAPTVWVDINIETGISLDNLNNAYATSSGTLAIGCIFFVPVALKYGRRPVYIVTSCLMTASAIWQGRATTTGDFIGANVIAGLAGAVNEALFQITVSDLFFVHQRASANGLYLAAVCVGNYLGPVAAGYVAVSQGWRWAFYYLTMFMGLVSMIMIFGLEESKFSIPKIDGQVLQLTRSASIAGSTEVDASKGDKSPATKEKHDQSIHLTNSAKAPVPKHSYLKRHRFITIDETGHSAKDFFRHCFQPFAILLRFPAVAFAALQYGWLVSCLSVVAVTQATLLPAPPYNFSASAVGLMNLPPAIGALLGSLLGGPIVDVFSVCVAKRRSGIHEPETRLWLFLLPGAGLILGVLLYGLTIAQGQPWILNAIGAGFVGFALGGCGDCALTYVQDSYQYILGDALVGVVFVRNAISTCMIFAVPPWMASGTYNMFVVMGVLSAFIALTSVPLIVWGRNWRFLLAGKYQYYANKQF